MGVIRCCGVFANPNLYLGVPKPMLAIWCGLPWRMSPEKWVRQLAHVHSRGEEVSTQPDFSVYVGGPVGAVEVKKPKAGILDDVNVLGEVFDQLMHLKNEWMVVAPFVLLTSYCEWRVCWLNDTESNALAGKECSLQSGDGCAALHPGVATPQKSAEEDSSPKSSPERHSQKVELGEVNV
jgi:hypothetical protein